MRVPLTFFLPHRGAYLLNHTLWGVCVEPPNIVYWNVTLFSLLVGASCLEIVLCGVQLVNATIGVFCGDCRKKEVGKAEVELWKETICSLLGPHYLFSTGHFSLRLQRLPCCSSYLPSPCLPWNTGINCFVLSYTSRTVPYGTRGVLTTLENLLFETLIIFSFGGVGWGEGVGICHTLWCSGLKPASVPRCAKDQTTAYKARILRRDLSLQPHFLFIFFLFYFFAGVVGLERTILRDV